MGSSAARTGSRSLRIFLAAVCVLLVVVFGTVQAAHIHADGVEHPDCTLCASAHITVQLAQTPAPAPVARVVARVELLPPAVLPSGFTAFSHFTRPPPAEALPA